MLNKLFDTARSPVLIRGARPVAFADTTSQHLDVLIGADGRIMAAAPVLGDALPEGTRIVEAGASFLSPGWTDLHVHIWYGGTDISIRPSECGIQRGVTTLIDAGSAGEANFHGLREFIIEPALEEVYAFLNIGSIGLVACNRVSELIDMRSIDLDLTMAVIEANRDRIVGLKVRASAVILGTWGLEPVRIAKKLSRIAKLPIMVHVGEPPPHYDEIIELLDPGDIVTHCFNGKVGGSIIEDDRLYRLVEQAAARGIILDIGHGGASFSFEVAEAAIARGLKPHTISTDLHNRSLDGSVWDLATTMSKLLSVGMTMEDVAVAATTAPRSAIGKPADGFLSPGARADLTLFDVVKGDLEVVDSKGRASTLRRTFEPRRAFLGTTEVPAGRHIPRPGPMGGPHVHGDGPA